MQHCATNSISGLRVKADGRRAMVLVYSLQQLASVAFVCLHTHICWQLCTPAQEMKGTIESIWKALGLPVKKNKVKQANPKNYLAFIALSHFPPWNFTKLKDMPNSLLWVNPPLICFSVECPWRKYVNTFQFYVCRLRTREILVSQKW